MADVRQMLRAERASRRITHPHASYTPDGKLLCNLCDTFVKSEAQWQSHLHSTQHNLRSQRAQDATVLRGAGTKRKAESPMAEVEVEDGRKRVRAEDGADEAENIRPKKVVKFAEDVVEKEEPAETQAANGAPHISEELKPDIVDDSTPMDDAELEALERDLAELESQSNNRTALNTEATISAAPLTAEQLAAQASEEQSTQRGRRDAEVEEEKEDAARVLEEEFEEMRGMEDRLKKLRERREELRRPSDVEGESGSALAVGNEDGVLTNGTAIESEDDEDEEFDDWGFSGVG